MKQFLIKYKRIVAAVAAVVLIAALVVVSLLVTNCRGGKTDQTAATTSQINPDVDIIMEKSGTSAQATEGPETGVSTASRETTKPPEKAESTAASSTAGTTAEKRDVPFATAIPPREPANYYDQWNMGYLVAIDNPDRSYACAKVTLTDEDRDLLERLCYGEFGSGGFVGAALIAQSVKDAMCFDGYPTVASVIKECRYTGSTTSGTSDACRQAVRYIFDDNCDAVQHRIMYMYNPYMVQSAFHESQNFILSYQGVRFFDRWGY